MKIEWIDAGREPKVQPNPNFPEGRDVDASGGAEATCATDLPYPAKRIGHYLLECETCGQRIAITTAGRPDDPRTVKVACKLVKPAS